MNRPVIQTISIGNRMIGSGYPTYVIAEISSNHNGSLETARELVRLSAQAGADAVKFQAYSRETLFAVRLPDDGSPEAKRDIALLQRRWEILPRFTVPDTWWPELKSLCDGLGVDFLCTSFDLDRLCLLDEAGVKAHKIASGDITWLEFLRAVGATGKPVILSTGASTLGEVEQALAALTESGCRQVAILHCVSNYPPKWEEANLRAIETLRQAFQAPVGFSDHSPGSTLPVAAVALGACIIEKHVTLDRTQDGLDHAFAMEMDDFVRMVEDVRHCEAALGAGQKTWVPGEEIERYWVRRGLWVQQPIQRGEVITRDKLRIVRPSHGLGADMLADVLGRKAVRDLRAGKPLERDAIA